MKKLISFLTMLGLILSITGFCFAAEPQIESQITTVETLEDGTIVETVFTVYRNMARTQVRDARTVKTYKESDGTKMASVTLNAEFYYDGSDAWVTDSYSDVTEYNGWNYGSERISESGNTARLSATLTKSGEDGKSVSAWLSCSANGTVTRG